jgi:hypothetical protein
VVTFVTKELDLEAFHAGIFVSDADLLSPVKVHGERRPHHLSEIGKSIKNAMTRWASYGGVAGIAQYSLRSPDTILLLGRADVQYRISSREEIQMDVQEFGEQVMRDVKQGDDPTAFIPIRGYSDISYNGPMRMMRLLMMTRVRRAPENFDISQLIAELGAPLAEDHGIDKRIVTEGYHLFSASHGDLHYQAFAGADKFDPANTKLFGRIEEGDGKLTWYQHGAASGVDFTPLLKR